MNEDDFPVLNPGDPLDTADLLRRAAAYGLVPAGEGLRVDLRYAGAGNFTGAAFYPQGLPALLHGETAAKLAAARGTLLAAGLDVLVWDAWRPPEAQVLLWQRVRDERYVARPSRDRRWSWHCYGRAVDVTLVDAASGELQRMPSGFDDFSGAGHAEYAGTDGDIARHLHLLQEAMTGAGFRPLPEEWWHFSDPVDPPPAEPLWLGDGKGWRKQEERK